jgi:DNA-binding SARP family transcriptional activator
MSEIRVRIIGESAIEGGGRQIRPKADVLFALALLLTVERGRRLPRPEIRAMLWPNESEDRAQHSLRQMLYKLRAMGLPISDTAGGLSVANSDVWVDFMDGDPESDAILREALVSPSGMAILPGFDTERSAALTDWADRARSRAEGAARGHLLTRIAAARQSGRWDLMEHAARNCLQLDPLNEAATQALAESMAIAGSKVSAARLIEEYNDEVSAAGSGLAIPTNLIKRRVLDQLAEGAATPDGQPLVEREAELTDLWRLALESDHGSATTVNITGPSGIGKSALLAEFRRVCLLNNTHTLSVPCTRSESDNSAIVTTAMAVGLIDRRGASGATPAAFGIVQRAAMGSSDNSHSSPATSLAAILTALGEVICAIAEDTRLIVTFDDLDSTTDQFRGWLATLVSSAPNTLKVFSTSRVRFPHSSGLVQRHIALRPLSDTGITQLFQRRAQRPPSPSELSALKSTTGGIPVYVTSAIEGREGHSDYLVSAGTFAQQRVASLSRQEQLVLLAASNMAPHGVIADLDSVFPDEPMTVAECVDSLCHQAMLELAPSSTHLVVHPIWSEAIRQHSSRATIALVASRTARALATPGGAPADMLRRQWRAMELVAASGHPEQLIEATYAVATQLDGLGHAQAAAVLLANTATECRDASAVRNLARAACLRFASLSDWANFDRYRALAGTTNAHNSTSLPETDIDLAVADLEYAHLHNASAGTAFRNVLLLAASESVQRDQALRLLLSAALTADSWCNREALAEITKTLETITDGETGSILVAQIQVVIETSLGNYEAASAIAFEVFASLESDRKWAEASRAARWCTFPLRHAGRFADCARWAERALELAKEARNIWLEAQALDTLATMQLELGDNPAAQGAIDQLTRTGIPAISPRYAAELAELKVRLSFQRKEYQDTINRARTELAETRPWTPRTEGMLLTWQLLAACAQSESDIVHRGTSRLLELWSQQLEFVGGFDATASALHCGLSYLGQEAEARALLDRYLTTTRTRGDSFVLTSTLATL